MRILQCPDCGSQDVEVVNEEGDDYGDQAEVECDDCGNIAVMTRVDPREVFK